MCLVRRECPVSMKCHWRTSHPSHRIRLSHPQLPLIRTNSFQAEQVRTDTTFTSMIISHVTPVRAPPVLQISLEERKERLDQQPVNDTAGSKSPDDIKHLNGNATTIGSFFCLHQSLSDGSIMTTFECAAKLRIQMGEACADDRFFVFCLRGLLLHVAAYLERARVSAHSEFKEFEDRFSNKEGKPLDDSQLTTKVLKLRWVPCISYLNLNVSFSAKLVKGHPRPRQETSRRAPVNV